MNNKKRIERKINEMEDLLDRNDLKEALNSCNETLKELEKLYEEEDINELLNSLNKLKELEHEKIELKCESKILTIFGISYIIGLIIGIIVYYVDNK